MPELIQTLEGADFGLLAMIAGCWGLELKARDPQAAAQQLIEGLQDADLVKEVLDVLPPDANAALQLLLANDGHLPWAMFTRRFGDVRQMGPGKRERERPDLKPSSISEILWYRALIGRAFLHFPPAEPQEYAYIPDDLLDYLIPLASHSAPPLGRPASPGECSQEQPAGDAILDQACTLLAALRLGLKLPDLEDSGWGIPVGTLGRLLECAGLLDSTLQPKPDPVRAFLEAPRPQALVSLVQAWMKSTDFNDLRSLPQLSFDGEWANDPLHARQAILDLLSQVPPQTWWSLPAFVSGVKESQPDFQRPAGDYDSWFIRRGQDEDYLHGFGSWDEVDGTLVHFYIAGPLHWLGLVDLGLPAAGAEPAAFRFNRFAAELWQGIAPEDMPAEEPAQLKLTSDGRIRIPPRFPRSARYLVARFCVWDAVKDGEYLYHLSPASLERARQQGLKAAHLVNLLRKHCTTPLPPSLVQALERWEKFGAQATLEKAVVLRVAAPEILAALKKTRAGRFLGEQLSPTLVEIRPGGEEIVQAALMEIGFLSG